MLGMRLPHPHRIPTGGDENVKNSTKYWLIVCCGWIFGAIVALIILAGCANTSFEVAAGSSLNLPWNGNNLEWQGKGPLVEFGIRHEKDNWYCELKHTSNLGSGWPFNNEPESWLDRVVCGRTFPLR
jgi:hypothetical protein